MVVRGLLVILLVAASGAYAYQLNTQRSPVEGLPALEELPKSFADGWASTDRALADDVAAVLAADLTLHRFFQNRSGAQVAMFIAYFKEQQVNSQIHSPRQCVPGGGWTVMSLEQTTLDLPSGPLSASRMDIQRQGNHSQIVYWFRTRGGTVTGEYSLKWDLIRNSIARRPTDAVFVRFSATAEDADAMHEMIRRLDQPLNAVLSEVGL